MVGAAGRAMIDGGMVNTLTAGSFFGELALITDIRRSSTVKGQTVCDINVLTRQNLVSVIADFPDVRCFICSVLFVGFV